MLMYPEIREYQRTKDELTTFEKAGLAADIMKGFQERGKIPGAYRPIWSVYQRRLQYYKQRKASRAASRSIPN